MAFMDGSVVYKIKEAFSVVSLLEGNVYGDTIRQVSMADNKCSNFRMLHLSAQQRM